MLGVLFLTIATFYYPGGTLDNPAAIGYSWKDNYISNLLRPLAVNGMDNPARPWAVFGILLMTISSGLFFYQFATFIKVKSAALVIRYAGLLASLLGFLIVIPSLHDLMVTLTSTLTLLIFFYITVITIKAKLPILSIVSVLFLALFYFATFMYSARFHLEYMPIMQKITFLAKIIWISALSYCTTKEDFEKIVQ